MIQSLHNLFDLLGDAAIIVVAVFLWDIKTNHLRHIYRKLSEVGERIARLEGSGSV